MILRKEMKELRQEMNIRFEAIYKELHEVKAGEAVFTTE